MDFNEISFHGIEIDQATAGAFMEGRDRDR
jgi:hypothetical protein